MFDKRITIFTGNFGSGKSEIALNYIEKLSKAKSNVVIVDLDVVNPFFRTSDAKEELLKNNISVISPVFAGTNIDTPALSPVINSVFENKDTMVVFDVGGDDLGARILSGYKNKILAEDYEMFFVVNILRPETTDVKNITDMVKNIENASGLRATALINNTNLLNDTSVSDILKGKMVIDRVSEQLGIPVGFVSGFYDVLRGIEGQLGSEVLYLDKKLRLPWE